MDKKYDHRVFIIPAVRFVETLRNLVNSDQITDADFRDLVRVNVEIVERPKD